MLGKLQWHLSVSWHFFCQSCHLAASYCKLFLMVYRFLTQRPVHSLKTRSLEINSSSGPKKISHSTLTAMLTAVWMAHLVQHIKCVHILLYTDSTMKYTNSMYVANSELYETCSPLPLHHTFVTISCYSKHYMNYGSLKLTKVFCLQNRSIKGLYGSRTTLQNTPFFLPVHNSGFSSELLMFCYWLYLRVFLQHSSAILVSMVLLVSQMLKGLDFSRNNPTPLYFPVYGNLTHNWLLSTGKYKNISVGHDARLCSCGLWQVPVYLGYICWARHYATTGRSWVLFPLRPMHILIDLILTATVLQYGLYMYLHYKWLWYFCANMWYSLDL